MSNKPATKSSATFLQRLFLFVRHPTTDWSQTQFQPGDRHNAAKEKALQRKAQKLERAAVLIRNREFDVLRREMRNRRPQSAGVLEGLTIPPTQPPLPLRAASRLHTLHKIDAIERQIRDEQTRQNSPTMPAGLFEQSGLAHAHFAASTLRPELQRHSTPHVANSQLLPPSRLQTTLPGATGPISPQGQTAPPIPPIIELAAFDFAEGRDAQAQSHLLTGLQTNTDAAAVQQIFQALLDFYWATNQADKLQSRSLEYVQRYGQTPAPRPDLGSLQNARQHAASFFAAEQFDILQLRSFERVLTESPTHLLLDWSALVGIPEPLRAGLADALRTLNDLPVELELIGADMLLAATRLQSSPTASADATLRLEVLRLVGDEAGFVDLAVDLSIACACSPVDWNPPRFKRVGTPERGLTTLHGTLLPSSAATQSGHADAGLVQTTVRLSGNLSGQGDSFLRTLRTQAQRADMVTVDLQAVQRMDFAAATDLLNWVDAQTQLGKVVELRRAHTLLAPFLQSVGLQILA